MRHLAAPLVLSAIALVAPEVSPAFRNAPIGTSIKNRTMQTIDGHKEQLLGSSNANVFVFFRTGQDHSMEALKQLADVERDLAGKSVHWVGIVSSNEERQDVVALVRETGIKMPVLIDEGDALYGELGVYLHPSIGIADSRYALVEYQPFRKINLRDLVRARIQVVLGDITEAQLAEVINPPAAPIAMTAGRAHARVKLARVLLSVGKVDEAIECLRAGLKLDPDSAPAHAALAEALARKGSCSEAENEFRAAIRLSPSGEPPAPLSCNR